MTNIGGGTPRWFDDIPPWPATEANPAQELARELASVRVRAPMPPPPVDASAAATVRFARNESPTPEALRPKPAGREPDTEWESFLTAEAARSKQKFQPDNEERTGLGRLWHDNRGPGLAAAAAAAIVVVLAGAAFALLQFAGGGESETPNAGGSTTTVTDASPSTADANSACPSTSSGGLTTGNDAGDQSSGQAVIMAFNHAYYVDRSAEKARSVAVPNAVAKQNVMQQYIDQLAPGTTHCLSITNRGNNTYGVSLTEKQPGKPDVVFQQTIEVVQTDGKYLIASIKADD